MTNVFDELQVFLPEYLQSKGINTNRHFSCIVPHGEDSTPSAHVYKEKYVKCFGCGTMLDIFDAAHYLEGLPKRGAEDFFKGNVAVLANRYKVPIGQLANNKTLEIYNKIVQLCLKYNPDVSSYQLHDKFNELTEFGPMVLKSPGSKVIEEELNKEFNRLDLISATVSGSWVADALFREHESTLFPLWSAKGICIGFTTRINDYIESNQPKYVHSANSSVFTKHEYLYGLHWPLNNKLPVYIVEGIKDAAAMRVSGLQALASLGHSFSKENVTNLFKKGFKNIIILTDNDVAGRKGAIEAIENCISCGIIPGVASFVEYKDAYEAFEANRIAEDLKTMNGIPFYFEHFSEMSQRDILTEKIFPALKNNSEAMVRTELLKSIVESLTIRFEDVIEDFDSYVLKMKERDDLKVSTALNTIMRDEVDIDKKLDALSEVITKTKESKEAKKKANNNSFIDTINKAIDGAGDDSYNDILLPSDGLGWFTDALHKGGLGYMGRMGLIAGDPHAGKTAFLLQFIAELLATSQDAMVCLFSTDDAADVLLPRLVSCMVKSKAFYIDDSFKPVQGTKGNLQKRAQNRIRQCAMDDRLVVKDSEFSPYIGEFLRLVETYRKQYPDRRLFVINDNFHRNSDFLEHGENSAVEYSAKLIKASAARNKFLYLGSAEYRKGKDGSLRRGNDEDLSPASNSDIKGASALQYFCDVILHLNNDHSQQSGDVERCLYVHEYEGELLPRVMATLSKNKISGNLTTEYLDLFPGSSFFKHVDVREAKTQLSQRKEYLIQTGVMKEKKKKDGQV